MMAVKLLVKIAVMMMAIVACRRHRKRRGEGAPSFSSTLTSSLDGRRGSPLVLGLHGMGGARAPPRLDLSLGLSLFLRSVLALLHHFVYILEIRNSDWPETFAVISFRILAFLRQNKSVNRLTGGGGGGESWARPLSPGHLGHHFTLILLPKNHKYCKKILRPFLSHLYSVMEFLRNIKHATDMNLH